LGIEFNFFQPLTGPVGQKEEAMWWLLGGLVLLVLAALIWLYWDRGVEVFFEDACWMAKHAVVFGVPLMCVFVILNINLGVMILKFMDYDVLWTVKEGKPHSESVLARVFPPPAGTKKSSTIPLPSPPSSSDNAVLKCAEQICAQEGCQSEADRELARQSCTE